MKKHKLLNIISIILSITGLALAIYGRESEGKSGDLTFYGMLLLVVALLVSAVSTYLRKKNV